METFLLWFIYEVYEDFYDKNFPDYGRQSSSKVGNDINQSKFYSRRNEVQIKFGHFLLTFSSVSCFFLCAVWKREDYT